MGCLSQLQTRNAELLEPLAYQDWLALPKVKRIYLDELNVERDVSLGLSMVRLVVEAEERTPQKPESWLLKHSKTLTIAISNAR
jgi:predicted transposase YdaD